MAFDGSDTGSIDPRCNSISILYACTSAVYTSKYIIHNTARTSKQTKTPAILLFSVLRQYGRILNRWHGPGGTVVRCRSVLIRVPVCVLAEQLFMPFSAQKTTTVAQCVLHCSATEFMATYPRPSATPQLTRVQEKGRTTT